MLVPSMNGSAECVIALVLLVQEASRHSSADLNKIKLYDFTVMESGENREGGHRLGASKFHHQNLRICVHLAVHQQA